MYIIAFLLALIGGLLISTQGILNAGISKVIGTPAMIAWLSLIQAIPPLILILIKQPAIGIGQSLIQGFKWYALSGVIGVIILTLITFSITKVGALTAFVIVVLGQVVGSAIADHFGFFGVEVKPVSLMRIISIIVIIAGVSLLLKSEPTAAVKEKPDISSSSNETTSVSSL